jgi:hypothetical protein
MEYRKGALHVVEQNRSREDLAADLRAIDDRLFLEKQLVFSGEEVWCVCVEVGGDFGVFTLLEWRDEDGNPLPLAGGIVDRVRRMDRDGKRLAAKVVKQNAARIERARQDAQEAWEEIGREGDRRMAPGYSAVLHRGPGLAAARRRARRQGRNV